MIILLAERILQLAGRIAFYYLSPISLILYHICDFCKTPFRQSLKVKYNVSYAKPEKTFQHIGLLSI